MCAINTIRGSGSCEGDSGGPLNWEGEDGGWVLIGVVQGGLGACGSRYYPSIFVRVANPNILAFIKDKSFIEINFFYNNLK